jgi:hypothetical protein
MMSCKLVVEGEFVSTEKMEEWGFSEYLYFNLFPAISKYFTNSFPMDENIYSRGSAFR